MIKISLLKFYFITFILSISLYSVGNTKNEFPLDPAITYGKLENGFWLNVLTDARQHNLSIERITNTDAMLKSISLNDIARLADYYFDENYTRTVQLLAE